MILQQFGYLSFSSILFFISDTDVDEDDDTILFTIFAVMGRWPVPLYSNSFIYFNKLSMVCL